MESFPTWMAVVALALVRDNGCCLMHRRPAGKHHAGLWEFPGGKLEYGEQPRSALVREAREELGIELSPDDLRPAAFADGELSDDRRPIVILLYTCATWKRVPVALEGGSIDWFSPEQVLALSKPPLDEVLASHLFQFQAG